MSNALSLVTAEMSSPAMRAAFDQSRVDDAVAFEREYGFAMQVIQQNNYLQGIAAGNLPSLKAAIVNVAAIGVSLNPARKQAYLVPRDGKVCLDISYMGLLDLATDTGSVLWGQANVVRAKDTFALNGLDRPPSHTFDPFATDRGDVIGAYCTVKTADGDYLTHTMTIAEIHAIRNRSAAWRAWVEKKKSCPWVTDEVEMAKKTVVKQASKYWPKNERIQKAAHHLNTEGGEGLAERDMGPADVVPAVDTRAILDWISQCNDVAEIRAKWPEWAKACETSKNKDAWASISAAATIRANELKPQPEAAA